MDATAARSILVRLALVGAVLAGLVAMHTLTDGSPHTAAVASVAAEHRPAGAGGAPSGAAVLGDCGSSDCMPLHAVGAMTCLLALLVAWVVSCAARPARRWIRAVPAATLALVATLRSVVPPPPSLVVLSISRT